MFDRNSNGEYKSRSEQLADRVLDFAVRIGKVVDALPNSRMGRHVAGQLVRCGTSPAPNYAEAYSAESRRDFIHKLQICLKELRETKCCLKLISRANLLPDKRLQTVLDECNQLIGIIVTSIVTAKRNSKLKPSKSA
jgi:four helix bundle protein